MSKERVKVADIGKFDQDPMSKVTRDSSVLFSRNGFSEVNPLTGTEDPGNYSKMPDPKLLKFLANFVYFYPKLAPCLRQIRDVIRRSLTHLRIR